MAKRKRKNKPRKDPAVVNKGKKSTLSENTPNENMPDENAPNESTSTGNISNENEPQENEPEEKMSEEKTSEESTSNKKDLDIQESLALINNKINELALKECSKKPQPNGFYNRWKLTLQWGFCVAEFCLERDGLLVCNSCKAAAYCCRDHQIKSFHLHKGYCFPVRDALKRLAEEEEKLRAHPGDDHLPANPFETIRGRFSSYEATSPYLDQRCRALSSLVNIRDGIAVEAMLHHCLEMLRLDNPDERCEGFKWPNFSGEFLSYHDEDVFESPNIFLDNPIILSNLICITQLKLKLFLDVRMLEREAKKHGSPASYETKMEWVCKYAVSDILYRRRDIVERDDWSSLRKSLSAQVTRLRERVDQRNSHYWPALGNCEKFLDTIPESNYDPGSPEEVVVLFYFTWRSWYECPLALTAVRVFSSLCLDQ
ncbi:hypothetical protein F4813DRAFT_395822 [Daldinia decipiens]|uniref:uncharacterized protein n=1 Tax=Daldinia decipiens TaxID=326647 RepID=UPI0020C23D54|nr:uncharacterized protein F4813DRAFT_395822 [Daldinia decipiens]KAI1658082.1 hypothetical protein F4813DRAFT_395822 [Daldinia decipiens]